MKGLHVCLRFFVLAALCVVVLTIAPAWAELTPQQLGQELKTALENNDLKKIKQLMAENPKAARACCKK